MTYRYFWKGTAEQIDAVTERMTRMFYEYQDQNGDCMDWCQIVADCLSDTESPAYQALQNVLKNQNQGNTDYGNAGSPTSNATDLAFGQNPTCDKDILWSQCVGLIQFINRTIVDVLEVVETYTNPAEVAAFLGDSVLGKVLSFGGTELADLIGSLADYTIETINDGYSAEYTIALEQEFACLLFCACQDDCQITVERVYQVFADRAGQSVIETGIGDLITAVTGIPIGAATVVPVAFYFWAGLLKTGSMFWYGAASTGLEAAIIYSSENPSNDWETLCTECEWSITITATNKPSWMTFLYGTLTDNDFAGVYPTALFSNNWTALNIEWTFPAVVNLTNISWKMVTAANVQSSGMILINDFIASKNVSLVNYATGSMVRDTVPDQIKTLDTSSQGAKAGQIQSIIRRASAPQPAFSFELTFTGIGYNPFA